jgi:hypothetical protein
MLGARKNHFSVPLLAMAALVLAPAAGRAQTVGDISITQTLNTSPLWADAASYHACNVVNVTVSTVTVTLELINANGGVIASNVFNLPGSTSREISDAVGAAGTTFAGFARCRFTLNNAPGSIRANMTIFHPLGGGTFQTYATSEAR